MFMLVYIIDSMNIRVTQSAHSFLVGFSRRTLSTESVSSLRSWFVCHTFQPGHIQQKLSIYQQKVCSYANGHIDSKQIMGQRAIQESANGSIQLHTDNSFVYVYYPDEWDSIVDIAIP